MQDKDNDDQPRRVPAPPQRPQPDRMPPPMSTSNIRQPMNPEASILPQEDSPIYNDQVPRALSAGVRFNFSGLKLAGLIFALVLVIFTFLHISNARLSEKYANAEASRTGVAGGVVSSADRFEERHEDERSTLIYYFDFETDDGQKFTGTSFGQSLTEDWHKPRKRSAKFVGGTTFQFNKGAHVEVHYDPSKPGETAVIKGQRKGVRGTDSGLWTLIGMTVLFFIVVGGSFYSRLDLNKLGNGLRIQAHVQGGLLYWVYQGQLNSRELQKHDIKALTGMSQVDVILDENEPAEAKKALVPFLFRPRINIAEDASMTSRPSLCNMLQHAAVGIAIIVLLLRAME